MAFLGGNHATNDAGAATITCAYSPSNTAGSLLVAAVSWDALAPAFAFMQYASRIACMVTAHVDNERYRRAMRR